MALNIPIDINVPNQSFNVTIGNDDYNIRLRSFRNSTFASITRNGLTVINSILCLPNSLLIPFMYLTSGGNFYWECIDGEYPIYTNFTQTQRLLWFSDSEIDEYGFTTNLVASNA